MIERILPIAHIDFRSIESESVHYAGDQLKINRYPVTCLKIIDKRFKVYVDSGFKGLSRLADDQKDYYIVDIQKNNTILVPSSNDYGSIVDTLEKMADKEHPLTAYVSDTKVTVLTMQNLVQDGWKFEQNANGDIRAKNVETQETKTFSDDAKLQQWILNQSYHY